MRFHTVDAAAVTDTAYDVVTAFECVHDLSNPVEVLDIDNDLWRFYRLRH